VQSDGKLHSRPMATSEAEFDGDLWFFTNTNSAKISEIARHQQVGVSYANPEKNRFVAVTGSAFIVHDRAQMKELWNDLYKAWFPDGLEDPTLCLIKVVVEQAEYWDYPSSKVVQLVGFVKALATGKPADDMGENEKINLNR
jgi:general stress protein 26